MSKTQKPESAIPAKPRICMFSQRGLQRLVSRCAEYEFEDIICETDDVEMLTPQQHRLFPIGQKMANRFARHLSVTSLNPGVQKVRLDRDYDLFIMICQFPSDLLSLRAIKGWKQHCRTSVCWLAEVWVHELPMFKGHMRILSQFDHVIIPQSGSIQAIRNIIGDRCVRLPPGIDTTRFCPYPNPPSRVIDVYSMGRKSLITHQALLKMAEQKRIFYVHDTCEKMETPVPRDHRILLANIAKRSRYFIANAPKINRRIETGGQTDVSYRFFEGVAAGTVMIGDICGNEDFKKLFPWPDAVIHLPFDSPNIAQILDELDSQKERLEKIRKENVIQSLRRHDWIYRWQDILTLVGLEPKPALAVRKNRLLQMAQIVENV